MNDYLKLKLKVKPYWRTGGVWAVLLTPRPLPLVKLNSGSVKRFLLSTIVNRFLPYKPILAPEKNLCFTDETCRNLVAKVHVAKFDKPRWNNEVFSNYPVISNPVLVFSFVNWFVIRYKFARTIIIGGISDYKRSPVFCPFARTSKGHLAAQVTIEYMSTTVFEISSQVEVAEIKARSSSKNVWRCSTTKIFQRTIV